MTSPQPDPRGALKAATEQAANHLASITLTATDPVLRRAAANAYDSIHTVTNTVTARAPGGSQ